MQYDGFKDPKRITNIYGLHICKTGGRFYHSSVLKPVVHSAERKIPMIEGGHPGHYGWHKGIGHNTFIVAGIRDIVKQKCSLFVDIGVGEKGSNREFDFSKETFLKWVASSHHAQNNMSKHFFYSEPIANYGMYLDPRPMKDLNIILERAARVNLYYDIDEDFTTAALSKKLSDALGIEYRPNINANTLPVGENPQSKALYDSLDESEKEFIRGVAFLDYQLYKFIKDIGK
jgi:hypothetical protein